MQEEIWTDCFGLDNYEVSNLGEIRHKKFKRILKASPVKNGFRRVSVLDNGKKKYLYLHRLVADSFLPDARGKRLSLRGDNSDAKLESIIVGDSEKPSGWVRDYDGQFAKIKPIGKESIINNSLNQYQIAKEYGLSQGWVSKIINGK